MAWDPNKKGTYANFTKTAAEYGGPDEYIEYIENAGYQKGRDRGLIEGAGAATALISVVLGIKRLVQKRKAKKQAIIQRGEKAKIAIQEMCEEKSAENDTDENLSENE